MAKRGRREKIFKSNNLNLGSPKGGKLMRVDSHDRGLHFKLH